MIFFAIWQKNLNYIFHGVQKVPLKTKYLDFFFAGVSATRVRTIKEVSVGYSEIFKLMGKKPQLVVFILPPPPFVFIEQRKIIWK